MLAVTKVIANEVSLMSEKLCKEKSSAPLSL
jgi:hypothetical protein